MLVSRQSSLPNVHVHETVDIYVYYFSSELMEVNGSGQCLIVHRSSTMLLVPCKEGSQVKNLFNVCATITRPARVCTGLLVSCSLLGQPTPYKLGQDTLPGIWVSG